MNNSVPSRNYLGISHVFRFTADAIDIAPTKAGVFVFFDQTGEAILIGSSLRSIQSDLMDHWKGFEGGETCGAEYVGFEAATDPLRREAELIQKHCAVYGKTPRRNIA